MVRLQLAAVLLFLCGVHCTPVEKGIMALSSEAKMDTLTSDQMEAGASDKLAGEIINLPAPNDITQGAVISQGPGTDTLNTVSTPAAKKNEYFDIVVTVPTVRRYQKDGNLAPEKYLAPMIDKLWYDMAEDQRAHVRFFILNSDKEPELHEEANGLANHPGVTLFTKMAQKEKIVDQTVAGHSGLEDGREVSQTWLSWVASENLDATFLFEKAKHQAPFILFLEDDVMPTTAAMWKLNNFIKSFKNDDWLFLDLYTPNLNWAEGMINFNSGDKYNFQCCTQAMLFRSDRIDGVSQYLVDHAREPIDDNLRNYMRDYTPSLGVYGIRPNLFQHVGAYSSNKEKSEGVVEHTSIDFVPLLVQEEQTAYRIL